MITIRPSRYFEHLTQQINALIAINDVPAEFKIDLVITEQALQFNMLYDKDIELLVEGVKVMINHIQDMVQTSAKEQYHETIYFPFGKHVDKTLASVIINIEYSESADFPGSRLNILRAGE